MGTVHKWHRNIINIPSSDICSSPLNQLWDFKNQEKYLSDSSYSEENVFKISVMVKETQDEWDRVSSNQECHQLEI
jgi:hypothetical protein